MTDIPDAGSLTHSQPVQGSPRGTVTKQSPRHITHTGAQWPTHESCTPTLAQGRHTGAPATFEIQICSPFRHSAPPLPVVHGPQHPHPAPSPTTPGSGGHYGHQGPEKYISGQTWAGCRACIASEVRPSVRWEPGAAAGEGACASCCAQGARRLFSPGQGRGRADHAGWEWRSWPKSPPGAGAGLPGKH